VERGGREGPRAPISPLRLHTNTYTNNTNTNTCHPLRGRTSSALPKHRPTRRSRSEASTSSTLTGAICAHTPRYTAAAGGGGGGGGGDGRT